MILNFDNVLCAVARQHARKSKKKKSIFSVLCRNFNADMKLNLNAQISFAHRRHAAVSTEN